MTREEWLIEGGKFTARMIAKAGAKVPELHVSVGFPKGARGRSRAIGQCFGPHMSRDGRPHVFICPTQDDPSRILDILMHEQIHAAVGVEEGHRGEFARVAREIGLVKPWTATTASPELKVKLNTLAEQLGKYPHAALVAVHKKRPGSRLRLWECSCGIKARVASDDFRASCGECGAPFERMG